jgi:hypothetical protein
MVEKADDLGKRVGERVSIRGVAQNAKAGAALVTEDDRVVYIKGRLAWPESRVGKPMVIEGILHLETVFPEVKVEDDAISQGLSGRQLVIEVDP